MDASPAHRDARMHDIKRKIARIGSGVESMHEFVDRLPQNLRNDARDALYSAFETGRAFDELNRIPLSSHLDMKEIERAGPEIRQHILQTRNVYREIGDLHVLVADLFDEKAPAIVRRILENHVRKHSGSSDYSVVA